MTTNPVTSGLIFRAFTVGWYRTCCATARDVATRHPRYTSSETEAHLNGCEDGRTGETCRLLAR